MSVRSLGALALVILAAPAFAAAPTVKAEPTPPPQELAEPVRALLDTAALTVTHDGKVLCTIWLRKDLPSKASADQVTKGLTYRELEETTLVGVVRLPAVWTDYRKQKIKAGVYTLRLGFQPQDGDHMGTAPFNEFCLLSPAAKDTNPATLMPKGLHELSAGSVGASHPGIMLLYPNPKPADAPAIEAKENNTFVLSLKRPVTAGGAKAALGFSFVVVGHTSSE